VRVADIQYKTKHLNNVCSNFGVAQLHYGCRMAEKIHQRIKEITAIDNVEMLVQYSIGRCHPLKGDRIGEYAMDLVHPFRLVFKKTGITTMQVVKILCIENYH
jgi:proteic killer suppression protein